MREAGKEISIVSPILHLICNAHLDPVWQWRWEEGASEALATFRNAVEILDGHPRLIFCHNEAVLYRWVERYDPGLFAEIRRLVGEGRWVISGGWFIQPDLNLAGTESLIRHIAEGRRYFRETFGAEPRVAYNFDSFGHSAGLPQILRQSGYEMYIHMRPQAHELALPGDLYRWRGADGTEIPAYRISVGLYHTERDNIAERLAAGVELALELGRDVPVFWGLGDHGGGATRRDLRVIDRFAAVETRVRIIHSTPDRFCRAVREAAEAAPLFEGGLQRVFTGCYTSLSRLKRRSRRSLGTIVQSEALAASAWWAGAAKYDEAAFGEVWRTHLFNDFHDILTGSCVEPAEQDTLDQYGRAEDEARRLRLGAVAALNRGPAGSPDLPITVASAVPSPGPVPVEFECQADYRPFWKGRWHLRLFRPDGSEVPCQEEQPEALLPFNDWRRRISFMDRLPGVGVSRYHVRAFETPDPDRRGPEAGRPAGGTGPSEVPARRQATVSACSGPSSPPHRIDRKTGRVVSLRAAGAGECLVGPLLEPVAVDDQGDSWGTGCGSYPHVSGAFEPGGPPVRLESGPIRTITQSVFVYGESRVVQEVCAYEAWPVLDVRLRVTWNERRRRLVLRTATRIDASGVLCEVPGGAAVRPADGGEYVHGRWLIVEGSLRGRPAALGIVNNGQPGMSFRDGEVRLSVLRSAVYCHERDFALGPSPARKHSDIGIHDIRLLVVAGDPAGVRALVPGFADYLGSPPSAYAHLPARVRRNATALLTLGPSTVRLLACKPSWDGRALVVRLQEAVGRATRARLGVAGPGDPARPRTISIPLSFRPFEIKTLRIERNGRFREAGLIDEL